MPVLVFVIATKIHMFFEDRCQKININIHMGTDINIDTDT